MATQHSPATTRHENIVPIQPLNMLEEMEHMFENFIPSGWMRPFRMDQSLAAETIPRVDVIDQEDSIVVKAALPGVNKKDLEVSCTDHTVTIRSKTRSETREEKGEYYRHEISTGSYLRTVTLPATVNENKIKAKFKNGLLTVTLPKLESAKRHSIKIDED